MFSINELIRGLNYLFAIPMILFGLIGSFLTIIVFTAQPSFRQNPTIAYLLTGAVITAMHLICNYFQSVLVDGFGLGLFNVNDLNCRQHNYFRYMSTVTAISFPCWAAFDQYVSTSRQASIRHRFSSMSVVRRVTIGTILFWSIFYIPIIFISRVVNGTCIMIDHPYRKVNNFLFTPLIFTIGPIGFIVIFTRGTIDHLRSTALIQQTDHFTKQIRRMLIPQLVVLIVSSIPFGLQNMYIDLTEHMQKDRQRKSLELLLVQIVRIFYHCNFVCSFYIYYSTSKEVRRTVRQVLKKYFCHEQISPIETQIDDGRHFQMF